MKHLLSNPISKSILIVLLYVLNAPSARAQLVFSLSEPAATYAANSGGTTIISSNKDEASSGAVNIGFTFTYGCSTYTQFVASSNGWMSLGNNTTQTLYTNSLATTGQGPILAPLWDDLSTSSTGSVNYVLSGTAPNRVLTIEWLNMLWDYNASGPVISFQVKLYETSNLIDFTYSRGGTGTNNASGGASIGLNGGSSATDFYSLGSSGAAPAVSYGTETSNISSKPATNQVYRWTPGSMAFVSSTTAVASAATISKCNNLNQVILGVQVVTSGCGNPAYVTQFQLNMTGSTAPTTDVTAIHIYYTGNTASFAPANEFIAGGSTPAAGTITITSSQALTSGTNYFWVAYDVSSSAVAGDKVQSQCTQLTVGGSSKTPSATVTGTRNIVTCNAGSVGPGGIGNVSFWVKAGAGTSTTTDGGSLSTWNDQSGNARNASSPATANNPTYYDNSTKNINFNPVVNFNPSSQAAATASYMNITSNGILSTGNNPYEVYAVVAPGAGNLTSVGKFLFSGAGFNGFNAFDVRAGNAFNDSWDVNDLTVSNLWTSNYPSLATFDFNSVQRQMFVSGGSVGTLVGNNRSSTNANDALGCQVLSSGNVEFYDGGIAEIITYANTAQGQATRNQVESYLGIKYGITLLHDYVASTGSTVWSRSLNASYNNNIIGIARDDVGQLSQKQSKSTSVTNDMLTMYLGTTKQTDQVNNTNTFSGGDKSFFMVGSNGAPILFSAGGTTDRPAGICCRLQRAWLSQKTNFTNANLTLQFDFNNVSPGYTPLFASDLRLLVDDDGVFSNATILGSPTISISVASSVVTVVVPASNITAAQPYFTLASVAVSTPLPVTITAFSASCQQKKVLVSWTSQNTENSSFAIERSAGDGNFVPVGDVANDQSTLSSYTWTDKSPLSGASAYRLKVTDNNSNAVSYSPIAPINGCGIDNNVVVVSDPATGKSSRLVIRMQQSATVDIGFYDVVGHQFSVAGLTGRHNMDPGVYDLSVRSQGLVPGVYFLSVIINGEKSVYRVIL